MAMSHYMTIAPDCTVFSNICFYKTLIFGLEFEFLCKILDFSSIYIRIKQFVHPSDLFSGKTKTWINISEKYRRGYRRGEPPNFRQPPTLKNSGSSAWNQLKYSTLPPPENLPHVQMYARARGGGDFQAGSHFLKANFQAGSEGGEGFSVENFSWFNIIPQIIYIRWICHIRIYSVDRYILILNFGKRVSNQIHNIVNNSVVDL